jgi:hypothetical protein
MHAFGLPALYAPFIAEDFINIGHSGPDWILLPERITTRR